MSRQHMEPCPPLEGMVPVGHLFAGFRKNHPCPQGVEPWISDRYLFLPPP